MSFMIAILETEPFRFIESNEPLKTIEDDMIPEKFKKQNAQGQGSQCSVVKSVYINEDSDEECGLREKDLKDFSKDVW